MNNIDLPDFKLSEFICPCCGACEMDKEFLWKLQRCRSIAGIPFKITSGFRCKKHNKEVGGVEESEHLIGRAADIYVKNNHTRFLILNAAIYCTFHRIGIGSNMIHLGNSREHPKEVVWLY